MLKREEEEIDGFRFTSVQFPAMYSFGLMARLVKSVGPAISTLMELGPDADIAEHAPMLAQALSTLDPDDAQKLVLEILKSTSVLVPTDKGDKRLEFSDRTKIDEFFTGKLILMFKAVGFALKTNFSDFLSGIDQSALGDPNKLKALTAK
jgi:hypothetical protein